ncbi:MAG: uncharacterized protein JWN08_46 [Frankiales bacterium]|jgi:hypothetical protein|nr:uncharacterized protein [Frankiales bacterium]
MQRGSDKHGFRLDDAMAAEVDGLVRAGHDSRADWNSPEPSGEDQPDVDLVPDGTLTGGVPEGMSADDVERRSELASYLDRSWPATVAEIVAAAEAHSAPDAVLATLRALPAGRVYDNLQDLWSALSGGHVEQHRF